MSATIDRTATSSAPLAAPAAKLRPKEHGAYAILAIPVITALLVAGWTWVGTSIAVAAMAGFLAHEPLMVSWGHRGRRAQRSTPAATRRLATLIVLTMVAGTLAVVAGGDAVRWTLLGCLILALVNFGASILGWHATLAGQLLGVIGLSLPSVPILVAGDISMVGAGKIWAVWLLGFSATTVAVRSVIATQKSRSRWPHRCLLTAITWLAAIGLSKSSLIAVGPMLLLSWYLLIWPPPAKRLKRVGWSLVVATAVTAGLVVAENWAG